MFVSDLLSKNARLYPEENAFICIDTLKLSPLDPLSYQKNRSTLTWRQFDDMANRVANYLVRKGIRKGDKIGIIMMNRIEYLPIFFGILRSGAVSVQINFRYSTGDLIRNADFTDLVCLFFDHSAVVTVSEARKFLPKIHTYISLNDLCPFAVSWSDVLAEHTYPVDVAVTPDDDAAIYFSSGTTGAPKAVVHSHATLEAACILEQSNHQQVHEDLFVLIPPLYHMGGKFHWIGNLLCGAGCVLMLGFRADVFFEILSREGVTISFLLLPWIQDILCGIDSGKLSLPDNGFPHWRLLHTGAQPIPPIVIHRIQKVFPGLACEISYGLTESGGPGCLNLQSDRMDKLGSIGTPGQGWQAKIINAKGQVVAAGQDGELLLKGPHMMSRYYKDPEATAQALAGGWLHTGDVARMDSDGFFYIDGRMKDVIISGGENVYPVPIEDFLRTHPGVKDAAVFGICDCRLGEVIAAQVSLTQADACTAEELLTFCQQLPKFERPRKIFIGEVPRNPTGKIDKVALRKLHSPKHPFQGHSHI